MDAVSNCKHLFRIIGSYGGVAGVNMTDPNYRPTNKTWVWLFLNCTYMASTLFTMCTYDTESAWRSSINFGIIVQGIVKYLVLITHSKDINAKVQFINRVYESNTAAINSLNFGTLHKWSRRGLIFAKYGFIPILSTSFTFVMWSVLVWWTTGERSVVLYFMVPGIDPDSLWGFVVLTGYHVSGLVLGVSGTCGADFMLIVLIIHLWPLADIFDNMCTEMNVALVDRPYNESPELRRFFYNLLQTHAELCDYLSDISRIYFYMTFCEIYTCAMSLCTLLYCLFTMTYIPAYLMWMLMFSILFLYCLLGTIAELAMDRIYSSLKYSKWYLLPVREQQCMQMTFAKAQRPTILMAGAMPLNMDSFQQVLKTVYSVGMLLLRSS